MWIAATAPASFTAAGSTPEWVNDWLGRRRKITSQPAAPALGAGGKSIGEAARDDENAAVEDAAAIERREAAQRKRAEDTRSSVSAALDELDQWISDQLRLGLAGFVDNSSDRCRRIAARLVDMKATALAGRIDEIPSRLMGLRSEERPDAAIRELGKLVLLAKAWRSTPDDAELRRLVSTSESREQVLANPEAIQVESVWEVLGEKIETRRDGLVSHSTWLLDLKSAAPQFALLLDYFPASAGRRSNAFTPGDRFDARLVFYPARQPLRALVVERKGDVSSGQWPDFGFDAVDPLAAHVAHQDTAPGSPIVRSCCRPARSCWTIAAMPGGSRPMIRTASPCRSPIPSAQHCLGWTSRRQQRSGAAAGFTFLRRKAALGGLICRERDRADGSRDHARLLDHRRNQLRPGSGRLEGDRRQC